MKRREFLRNGSMLSLPLVFAGHSVGVLAQHQLDHLLSEETDRVFVLIQQNGGNDGLNTIIPIDQYSTLSALRSNILIPEKQVLPLTAETGLHPVMTGIKSLFDESVIKIIQNVGYPNQNRSHFRSTDIWDTGSVATESRTTGWIGRYLDSTYPGYPEGFPNSQAPHPIAITLGPSVSETCQGIAANFSLAINDPTALATIPGTPTEASPEGPYGDELEYVRQIISQTNIYAEILSAASESGANRSDLYPEPGQNRLADQLRTVVRLISGGLQTRIYVVNINGFDTHANQADAGNTTAGRHADLLSELSEAILAFMDDLRQQGLDDRVIGATRSEFGRQIASNGSQGTDHGDAAPILLFGSCVNAGITGSNPEIPQDPGPQSGVEAMYDFKNVFGSILMDWFGASENQVQTLFSHDFAYMPLIEACNQTTARQDLQVEGHRLKTYPNPFFNFIQAEFEVTAGQYRASLINNQGQVVIDFGSTYFPSGKHEVEYQINDLRPGHYLFQLHGNGRQLVQSMLHF